MQNCLRVFIRSSLLGLLLTAATACQGGAEIEIAKSANGEINISARATGVGNSCIDYISVSEITVRAGAPLESNEVVQGGRVWGIRRELNGQCLATFVFGDVPVGYEAMTSAERGALAAHQAYRVDVSGAGFSGLKNFTVETIG